MLVRMKMVFVCDIFGNTTDDLEKKYENPLAIISKLKNIFMDLLSIHVVF
jgi:hypothetical protein